MLGLPAGAPKLTFMRSRNALVPLLVLSALATQTLGLAEHPTEDEPETLDFTRDVRPILSDKCFQCHGPDPETRAASFRLDTREGAMGALASGGHAIVPGDLDESELVYRIDPESDFERMPPEDSGKTLSTSEIATLKRWVDEGAAWSEHWSFQRPARDTSASDAGANDLSAIDALITRRLSALGLELQSEADLETLLRRVSLDLTGLQPTPDEQAMFRSAVESHGVDAAYRGAVERLLESPRYGVHMARTWLDAARYADTHGLHLDNRRSMWPYRDWVVDAFNANMPFDQFTIEQLAGDLLPNATLSQKIASGFNRCNPTSAEGGMIADEYLSIYAKDRADTTSTVWLGLTLACAQCHDHKYDPITQRDYYSMYAFFNSLDEKATDQNIENPVPFIQTPTAQQTETLAEMDGRLAALQDVLDGPRPDLDALEHAWSLSEQNEVRRQWRNLVPESAAVEADGPDPLVIDPTSGVVSASGAGPESSIYSIDAWVGPGRIDALRIDALVPEGHALPGRASNDNFVLSYVEVLAAPTGRRDELKPIAIQSAAATFSQEKFDVAGILDPSAENGWAGLGTEGPRSALLTFFRPLQFDDGAELRVRLHFESQHKSHSLARVRLALRRAPMDGAAIDIGPWQHSRMTSKAGDELLKVNTLPKNPIEWTPLADLTEGRIRNFRQGVDAHFLRTTIKASDATDVELRVGSDDKIAIWLNGTLVHENDTARATKLDDDNVDLKLKSGANELLVKVVNTGGASGFVYRLVQSIRTGKGDVALPSELELALLSGDTASVSPEILKAMKLAWRRAFAPDWAATYDARVALALEKEAVQAMLPTTLVSRERMERRVAYVQDRGAYDKLGDAVEPAPPSALPPLPEGERRDRLGLARWLVSGANPLTSRVWVNRSWQHFFGRGLVATPEDFGAQGDWPSHPELLDLLALDFEESGWDVKGAHRRIVMSQAYRQSSTVTPELLELDPANELISRGPRYRLDGEVLRDQALHAAGLLNESMGGPGVRPYQPDGVWFAVGYSRSNTVRYAQGPEDHLHRRSLYTFWKRTAPPPNLTTFDAPMRDACTVKRERTNTPLQALITLNDPTYVEAARFVAERVLTGAKEGERIQRLFEIVAARAALPRETEALGALIADLKAEYEQDVDAAKALLAVGDLPASTDLDPAQLAAWTLAASAVLNLDDVLTKN